MRIIFKREGNFIFNSNVLEWRVKEVGEYNYFYDKNSGKNTLKIGIQKKFNIKNPENLTFDCFLFGTELENRKSNYYNLVPVPYLYLYPNLKEPKEQLIFIRGLKVEYPYDNNHIEIDITNKIWEYNWQSLTNNPRNKWQYSLVLIPNQKNITNIQINGKTIQSIFDIFNNIKGGKRC